MQRYDSYNQIKHDPALKVRTHPYSRGLRNADSSVTLLLLPRDR